MKKENLKVMLLKRFTNSDGTLNKSVIASVITLTIVLIQQIMLMFGFSYGHWDQVVAVINTILTIAGLLGVVEGDGNVTVSQSSPTTSPTVKPAAMLNLSVDPNAVAASSLSVSASRAEYLQSLATASRAALRSASLSAAETAQKEAENSVSSKD